MLFSHFSIQLIVYQILKAKTHVKYLRGISKFLILYNILEQLKVTYGNSQKEESFNFTLSKKDTNSFILNALLSIKEIVKESDKEEFHEHIKNHVKTVKYKKMKDQFIELFELYYPSFLIDDLVPIIKLRNKIFHGNMVVDTNLIDEINKKLKHTVGKILLNIILFEEDSAANIALPQ